MNIVDGVRHQISTNAFRIDLSYFSLVLTPSCHLTAQYPASKPLVTNLISLEFYLILGSVEPRSWSNVELFNKTIDKLVSSCFEVNFW